MEEEIEILHLTNTLQMMQNRMADTLTQQMGMYCAADMVKDLSSCAANALSTGIMDSIQMTSDISEVLIDKMIQSLVAIAKEFQNVDYAAIAEETLETFRKLEPFVPEGEKEKFKELVEPQQGKERKIFTAENVKWLLGIIIPVLLSNGSDKTTQVHIEDYYNIEISVENPQLEGPEEFFEKILELPDGRKLVLEIKRDGKIEGKNDSVDDSAAQSRDTQNPQHNGDNDCKNNPDQKGHNLES